MEFAFRAECIDNAVSDSRCGTRTFVETEVVAIDRGVVVLPLCGASVRIESLDNFASILSMKQDDVALRNNRTGKSLSDVPAPKHFRTTCRPFLRKRWTGIDAVSRRAEELRPVVGWSLRAKRDCKKQQWNEATHRRKVSLGGRRRPPPVDSRLAARVPDRAQRRKYGEVRARRHPGKSSARCMSANRELSRADRARRSLSRSSYCDRLVGGTEERSQGSQKKVSEGFVLNQRLPRGVLATCWCHYSFCFWGCRTTLNCKAR